MSTENIIKERNRKKHLDFISKQDDEDLKTLFDISSIKGAVKKLEKKKEFLKKFI
jgi:flagellar motility protein MotE (MotC chaperone)